MSTDLSTAEAPKQEEVAAAHGHPEQTHKDAAAVAPNPAEAGQEFEQMRSVVLDAAELATRSGQTAAALGGELKDTNKALKSLLEQQNKRTLALFGITGALLVFGALVFGAMTVSLKARLNHLDEMLGAMSKRVGELNESLEVVASVNEGLKEMVSKQSGIAANQAKLGVRIDEMMASTQSMPALAAKQIDDRGQALVKQVQSIEGRLQGQAQALQALGVQMNGLRTALGETGGLKREMEALARMQRERQQAEAISQAQANQAKAAEDKTASAANRQRDKMVQYPRIGDSSPTPGAGVLNTK
jgi:hypothetical protein